jgi:hypothetical protein
MSVGGIAPALRGGAMSVVFAGSLLALCACGDDGGGGAAGGPAPPGSIGEPCGAGCATGLACATAGPLVGLCTVGCTNDQSCELAAPGSGARCIGQTNSQCALTCAPPGDCPEGTHCGPALFTMACVAH